MKYSNTAPNHCGDFRIQNIELPTCYNVATRSLEDGKARWRFLNGDTLIDEPLMLSQWRIGPEVTYADDPARIAPKNYDDPTAFAVAQNVEAARASRVH